MKTLYDQYGTLNVNGRKLAARIAAAITPILQDVVDDGIPVHEVELLLVREATQQSGEMILINLINSFEKEASK